MALGADRYLAVGNWRSAAKKNNSARWVWLSGAGTPTSDLELATGGAYGAASVGAAAWADGSAAIVGLRDSSPHRALLHVYTHTAKKLWEANYEAEYASFLNGTGTGHRSFLDAAVLNDQSLVVIGAFSMVLKGTSNILWSRYSKAGVRQWAFWSCCGKALNTIAASPLGYAVAGGWVHNGGIRSTYLTGIATKDGALLWQRTTTSSYFTAHAMAMMANGHAIVAGTSDEHAATTADPAMWFSGIDRIGNTHWTAGATKQGRSGAYALALVGPGDLVLVGWREVLKGIRIGQIVRSDPWGHTDCKAAGKCSGATGTSCDDKNPCTSDFCDPKLGCRNIVVGDQACAATAYADIIGSCQAGKCVVSTSSK